MATIKQIDGRTIHQIQSGQVIIDLCSVVKELIENSIDAEATSIDVRFKNQGLDLIEVQDNGTGISPSNYPSVALKHHTSKLSSYSDIASLQTFGFRGEALASLCALSVLSVMTCQASDVPKGAKLAFEPSGELGGTTIVAAQRGTTVSVEKLFHNLPVRRRELERNIKREWHKVIALLNQYACIQTNLKFSVSQQPTKGKRIHLFSTRGNPTTRENIINIFGAKTMAVLVPLDLKLEMEPSTVGRGPQKDISAAPTIGDVHVVGHVSRPSHGDGRQMPDRQMFFVNGRPCGLPQFAKVFNEVYRTHNSSQNPFILANIQLDTDMYDVNVSPDKRSILLHDQNNLLETLRNSLMALFDSHDHSLPVAQLLKPRQPEAPSSKPTPTIRKTAARPTTSSDNSDPDSHSESEASDDKSPIGRVPPGRARTVGNSRSLMKDDRGQNLISRWVENKTESRPTRTQMFKSPIPEAPTDQTLNTSTLLAQTVTNVGHPIGGSELSESGEDDKPRPVLDFNKRLVEASKTSSRVTTRTAVPSSPSPDEALDQEEPQSPGVQPYNTHENQAPQSSHKPNALEVTTLFIGDHIVGHATNSSKEPIHETVSVKITASEKRKTGDEPHPSFGNRLTQLFSAHQKGQDGDGNYETLSNDEEDEESGEEIGQEVREESHAESEEDSDRALGPPNSLGATVDNGQGNSIPGATLEAIMSDSSSSSVLNSREDRPEEHLDPGVNESQTGHEGSARLNTTEQKEHLSRTKMQKKDATFQTVQHLRVDEGTLRSRMTSWIECIPETGASKSDKSGVTDLGADDAEEKLSLAISKGDFLRMRIVGQFNLGFIIAVRPAKNQIGDDQESVEDDELFIIDQHATDEKYNFERLQATTVVQSQRLVRPKQLELTALEEEIVMENIEAIEANGFKVSIDTSGDEPVGSRCQLLALPLSRETTFTLADLEELISLLGDESSESKHIPRPSKVRKMFAMRACRSSIMIGKPLKQGQMETLVRHMGELDKPWNCPHGRPTMRHLCKLQLWDEKRWKGDQQQSSDTAWRSFALGQ
ncbi:ATP-binding mismatch repair protein [Neonectria magnoliae]|uniref:ATP-binding mismatch repair protein n=1 Tax=Neonectria magnoliae TaxID=2732573 RepID=A0ABR1HRL7_9HYPO